MNMSKEARIVLAVQELTFWLDHPDQRNDCVAPMHAAGQGFPDLVVGTPARRIVLLEVKDWAKRPSERRLTPEQEAWHALWAGYPIYVVETTEQALEAVK